MIYVIIKISYALVFCVMLALGFSFLCFSFCDAVACKINQEKWDEIKFKLMQDGEDDIYIYNQYLNFVSSLKTHKFIGKCSPKI